MTVKDGYEGNVNQNTDKNTDKSPRTSMNSKIPDDAVENKILVGV